MSIVFVSIPNGGSAGSVLRTGVIGRVLDADASTEVVLISPLVKDSAFVREFEHRRVRFEDLPAHRPAGLEARLLALLQSAYIGSAVTESVRIRRAEAMASKSIRWIGAKRLLARAVAPSVVAKETRYRLIDRLVSHSHAETLFDRYRPALLVASSPGLIFAEVPLLRTAVRRGVRSMALDPSWDNFTNKLLPVRRVNRLIVWNDLMKQQAVDLHGYQPDEVRVAGAPQWDVYFRSTGASRDTFFGEIGADPSRKLITLSTTPRELYSHHDHVVRVLIRAMTSGAWPWPVQLLVRLHPRDEVSAYANFQGVPHVTIEKPFRATGATSGDGLSIDITAENQQHLADTMRHSDVVVNVASTLAVEASIVDTPVVNISFDGEQPTEWVRSARRYYRFTHYVNVTRHNAARVAETPEQLVEYIGRYLADPSLDREGRRRVAAEQCQFFDGRSASRVAAFVVSELADVSGLPSPSIPCVESLASSR
jgi:CDP-glycerol:poly(glycerophosphate) glycerophosphotransferase